MDGSDNLGIVQRVFHTLFVMDGAIFRVRSIAMMTLVGAVVWFTYRGIIDGGVIENAGIAALAYYFGTRSGQ